MKKQYEKNQALFTSIFILILLYLIFINILFTSTLNKYILINAVVENESILNLIINDKELKYLKANHYVYIKNDKYKRKILEINRNILKKDNQNYHAIKIKININKKYKTNDNVTLRVVEKKEDLVKIFKSCWKEK